MKILLNLDMEKVVSTFTQDMADTRFLFDAAYEAGLNISPILDKWLEHNYTYCVQQAEQFEFPTHYYMENGKSYFEVYFGNGNGTRYYAIENEDGEIIDLVRTMEQLQAKYD